MRAARTPGLQVALDDFGTGYSSLSYLKKFDIDTYQDRPVLRAQTSAGSDDLVLCKAVIVMAHALELKVVAEGIETREQCKFLTPVGCDYGQGYLFFQAAGWPPSSRPCSNQQAAGDPRDAAAMRLSGPTIGGYRRRGHQ